MGVADGSFNAPNACFIAGAMKAGTTSLFQYLAAHPEVFPSSEKEPSFFTIEDPAPRDREAYDRLFSGRRSEPWILEASTNYSKHPFYAGVPERIVRAFPEARIILVLREPVLRTWSHYTHNRLQGRETREPGTALFAGDFPYLAASRYHGQIAEYLKVMPAERLLVFYADDLLKARKETVARVYRFLGIDDAFEPPNLEEEFHRTPVPGVKDVMRRVVGTARFLAGRAGRAPRPAPRQETLRTPELDRLVWQALRDDFLLLRRLEFVAPPPWDMDALYG
jgi:hypothetical protein